MKTAFAFHALVLTCLFALAYTPVLAARTEISIVQSAAPDPIKDATVNLYCRLKSGKKIFSSSGSGIFISDRGIILTNAHVAQFFLLAAQKGRVSGWCSVRTGSPAKERYTATVLYFPTIWIEENASELAKSKPRGTGENDFALLYVTGATKGTLPTTFPALPIDAARSIADASPVTIAGYPTEDLDFDEIRNKLTLVTASSTVISSGAYTRTPLADAITLAPSAAGSPGVSGGSVVDSSGWVVGMATSKSTAKNDRTLRAITPSYINRTLVAYTGSPLSTFLSGDLARRASTTEATITPALLKTITSGLLKKK